MIERLSACKQNEIEKEITIIIYFETNTDGKKLNG